MFDQKDQMTTPTIEINMDMVCWKCGKKGIAGSGLCLSCATKMLTERNAMLDHVSFAGIVTATSTNWPKHETRISVGATYGECGEIEAASLGEIMRDETMVNVSITDTQDTGEMIEFTASIEGVRTDWAKNETIVTFKVFTPSREFESKSSVLGAWGERALAVEINIAPSQGKLL